ncbi:hypothetical protein Tco_0072250 [Tanacetum coccineum]
MSSETKLTKDEEGEFVDNTKYRGMIGIVEDDVLDEDTNVCTPLVECSNRENLRLKYSDDKLLIDTLWFDEDSVNEEEVIGDMNSSLDNNVEKLSQDDSEMPYGMEGDLPTWIEDEDDSISGMEGEYLETFSGEDDDDNISSIEGYWLLDPNHEVVVCALGKWISDAPRHIKQVYQDVVEQVTDPVMYEEAGDQDVVEHVTNLIVYEKVRDQDVVEHVTAPVVYYEVGDQDVVEHVTVQVVYYEVKYLIKMSDSRNVISESTRKMKMSNQDDIASGYAPIGIQRNRRRLNQERGRWEGHFYEIP